MQIRTNNKPRPMLRGYELIDVQRADFDYLKNIDDELFFWYKQQLYALADFTRIDEAFEFNEGLPKDKQWEGYAHETVFSGLLIRVIDADDGYDVVVGTYTS